MKKRPRLSSVCLYDVVDVHHGRYADIMIAHGTF